MKCYDECIERIKEKDGTLTIRCIKGNFSVNGIHKEIVEEEALRYWMQYAQDGEYEDRCTCGSKKDPWFSRTVPMGYFCEECGREVK